MNTQSLIAWMFFCITCLPGIALAEDEKQADPVPRKLPTHTDINAEREKYRETHKTTHKKVSTEPIVNIKPRSLIARSTLLANAGAWTLVPKGALVYLPSHLKSKIVTKPTGKLVKWKEFYIKNAGWIHVHPVKMSQAQGKEALKPEVIKAYKSMGKIVIATCAGGPISVAPDALQPEPKKDK